jgi:exopolysaccharide biosynthesis operon protein EpsL
MSSSRLRPLALLAGVMCSAAVAAPGDLWQAYGNLGFVYDDNLLRVPDHQPAFDNTRGDSWVQAEVGLTLDKSYQRQRIVASAKVSKYSFDHFDQLDYVGKDLQATWYWQLGNHLEGKAGATYVQTLAPYTDFRSNERNLRQQRRGFADGAWRFHPRWRARAGLAHEKFTYDLVRQRFNDRSEDTGELEADYLPPTGSTIGLVLRRIKGRYPNGRPVGPFIVDDDFTQDEIKARVDWLASGVTKVQVLAGWARRRQPSLSAAAISGVNGRIGAEYTPRGTVSYNAAVWRDFAPLESSIVSYTLNRGVSIGATWAPTSQVKVDANAIYERRKYSARFAFPGGGDLDDALRSANLRATWSPRRYLQVMAGYAYQSRTGSPVLGLGQFGSNSVSFNVTAQF